VDNVILVTNHGEITDATNTGSPAQAAVAFVRQYRLLVRPQTLFVNIDLGGGLVGVSHDEAGTRNPNDIYVSGYSDQILRFIADRGDGQQMAYINSIDKAKQVAVKPRKDLRRKEKFGGFSSQSKKQRPVEKQPETAQTNGGGVAFELDPTK